jgi:hypothetical protein
MRFFTSLRRGNSRRSAWRAGLLLFCSASFALAENETNTSLPGPGEMSAESSASATNAPANNAPAANAGPALITEVAPVPAPTTPMRALPGEGDNASYASFGWTTLGAPSIFGALMTLTSLGGFLLYQCGLTRAKNSGHTSTLLLVGAVSALTGYWIGGFAVQTGGIGDAHAALAQALSAAASTSLDHELGPIAFGHHWGLMGSSGFFLATDDPARNGIAALFLMQAALLALAVAGGIGA